MKNIKMILCVVLFLAVDSVCGVGFDLAKLEHVPCFYFLRHAQTDHNIRLVPQSNGISINQTGQLQAAQAQRVIEKLPINMICFSPLRRAVETKNIVNKNLRVDEKEVFNLRESNGDSFHELQKVKNKIHVKVSKKLRAFLKRVWKGLLDSLLLHQGPVLIVSHGGVYSALCRILSVRTDMWAIGNCGIVYFYQTDKGDWHVKEIFDLSGGHRYDLGYMPHLK